MGSRPMNPQAKVFRSMLSSPSLLPATKGSTEEVTNLVPSTFITTQTTPAITKSPTHGQFVIDCVDFSSSPDMTSTSRFQTLVKDLSDACASLSSPGADSRTQDPNTPLEATIAHTLDAWNAFRSTARIGQAIPAASSPGPADTDMIKINLIFE